MRKNKSSKNWIIQQHRDPYFKEAKHSGFRSRSAYKLLELEMGILLNQSDERRGYSQALIEGIKTSNADFVFFSDLRSLFPKF